MQKIKIEGNERVWYVDISDSRSHRYHSQARSMSQAIVLALQHAYIRPLTWKYHDGKEQCYDGESCIGEVKPITTDEFEWWVRGFEGSANTRENGIMAVEVLYRTHIPKGLDYERTED